MSSALNVFLPGHIDPYDSYGLIGCQLARHLARAGTYVNLFAMGKREMDSHDPELNAIVQQPIAPAFGGIFLGYPTGYDKHENALGQIGPRVCITMFESSKIPPAWVPPLNEMDAVIVPSWFCADVFRECGVTAPVHVVPLGVGECYRYAPRPSSGPLTFLAFMDRGARKGALVALQSFLMAFGESLDYRLILKTRKRKTPLEFTNPNIEVVQEDLSEEELCKLYQRCHVLINPHKGEGFGLIPREFAASGGLSLTTKWSGTADGVNQWGLPLPYSLEAADWSGIERFEGMDLGEWAKVDPAQVAPILRHVADRWDALAVTLRAKAQAASSLYRWQTFAEQVIEIWKGVADGRSNRLHAA